MNAHCHCELPGTAYHMAQVPSFRPGVHYLMQQSSLLAGQIVRAGQWVFAPGFLSD
jgi:ABC-type iron transport system FetAB ATPase subunit